MPNIRHIRPCLWFDHQAEEAARYYVAIFGGSSRITQVTRYTEAGFEIHGRPAGSVMVATFELQGHKFIAMNGGPVFKFNEAVSLAVACDTQQELDYFWDKLSAGGDPQAQQCGWLKDKYGLSWQIVPAMMDELMADDTSKKGERVMNAMLQMKKIDIAGLQRAAHR